MIPGHRLFSTGPIERRRDEALAALRDAVSRLAPARLETAEETADRLVERHLPAPPRLGRAIRFSAHEARLEEMDALARRREGWGALLEFHVPFTGDAACFGLWAGAAPADAPEATIRRGRLVLTVSALEPEEDSILHAFDRQLACVERELEEQRRRCDAMRGELRVAALEAIAERRGRLAALDDIIDALLYRGYEPVRG